ncbi:hypothetical protein HC028_10755 [Planosporangium flavigriseum]|uniref:Uncharacterized protein n=1 Tax=Planosporangium flavigriseum TaxID=373681 RepID=A0A8J3LRR1_9ACTN|nr:hypothetical protein [Planosporangium flavigriseum]NJC64979.1 hypothetical protein [Planosporangium flavigriseum]GIG76837.1 hypothetical protein Pfl04_52410 [Planosporangium flavigriseum]
MLLLQPVIQVVPLNGFALWPISTAGGWLALSEGLSADQVGSAVAAIAAYNHHHRHTDWQAVQDPMETVRHLVNIDPEAGALVVAGGLRLTDDIGGVTIDPGCCCGLET